MNALIQRPDALLAVRYAVMGTPQQALVVPEKAEWLRNFHRSTLHALKKRVKAAGLRHPSEVSAHHIVRGLDKAFAGQLGISPSYWAQLA